MSTPTEPNMQIIKNATRDDVCPGDHITWEQTQRPDGATITERREGIAHHRDSFGDWCTERGARLTSLSGTGITLTIRRAVQELPAADGAVIVPADGCKFIEAEDDGTIWRTREAACDFDGDWVGAWRSGERVIPCVTPDQITPGTWKEADQ